ncbi:hypothetical protein VTN02DRAFT_5172 [Thermoascus thermophilus]
METSFTVHGRDAPTVPHTQAIGVIGTGTDTESSRGRKRSTRLSFDGTDKLVVDIGRRRPLTPSDTVNMIARTGEVTDDQAIADSISDRCPVEGQEERPDSRWESNPTTAPARGGPGWILVVRCTGRQGAWYFGRGLGWATRQPDQSDGGCRRAVTLQRRQNKLTEPAASGAWPACKWCRLVLSACTYRSGGDNTVPTEPVFVGDGSRSG